MSSFEKPILVIEDDPDLLALLNKVLTQDGWRVQTASDTPGALDLCEREAPGLMIVDLMLPHMDGEAFLAEFRARWPDAVPPVLLLSASAIREEVADRMRADASLAKPFELDDLRDLVRQLAAG